MSTNNEQIRERLKNQLDGSTQDEEYALKILCGLEPLDDLNSLKDFDSI